MKNTSLKAGFLILATIGLVGCGSSGGSKTSASDTATALPPHAILADLAKLNTQSLAASISELLDEESLHVNENDTLRVSLTPNGRSSFGELSQLIPVGSFKRDLASFAAHSGGQDALVTGDVGIYRLKHSAISAIKITDVYEGSALAAEFPVGSLHALAVYGDPTVNFPEQLGSKVDYRGNAFNAESVGTLSYSVDFSSKTGEGSIIGLGPKLILDKASLGRISDGKVHGIGTDAGTVSFEIVGKDDRLAYDLMLMGPNAEELVGSVSSNGHPEIIGDIIFGGSR